MLVFVWAAIGIMVEQSDNTIDMVALGSAITVGIIAILVWAYNIFEIVKYVLYDPWKRFTANYFYLTRF